MSILEALFEAVQDKKISEKTFERVVEKAEYQHYLDSFLTDYDY